MKWTQFCRAANSTLHRPPLAATNQSLFTKSWEFLSLSFTWWDIVDTVDTGDTRGSLSLIWVLIVQCKYASVVPLSSPTLLPLSLPPSLAQEIWVLSLILLGMAYNKHLQVQVWSANESLTFPNIYLFNKFHWNIFCSLPITYITSPVAFQHSAIKISLKIW